MAMLWAMVAAASVAPAQEAPLSQKVDFNRDIRPILSNNCFACHGPDEAARESGLRLDLRSGAIADMGGYAAIVPGDVESSELITRITAADADDRMPPADSNKKLEPREIQMLRRWVEQGAAYESHWAFIPPRKAQPSAVRQDTWPRNGIDHFVLARLEKAGFGPAPEADRRTLIRRLSFDLTGLPPTAAEVEAFVNDTDPKAYEKLVDRLLASKAFGERMAAWWLDLVRYADTVGYHGDQDVSIWPFREWVIKAFNANMRFDQFTIEQLAGDLLPNPTLEQKIASGYNRLGMMTAEGGAQDKEYLAKYMADRVRNASSVWLGATLGCAECHDHKFDPFTARDFYSFGAFFADIKEKGFYGGANKDGAWGPMLRLPAEDDQRKIDELRHRIAAVEQFKNNPAEVALAQERWENKLRAAPIDWQELQPQSAKSANGAKLDVLEDRSILASGESPDTDTYTLTFDGDLAGATALRLEALPDSSLPANGPGRAANGNFVVEQVRVKWGNEQVQLVEATASFEQDYFHPSTVLIKNTTAGWAIAPQFGKPHDMVLRFAERLKPVPDAKLTVTIRQYHGKTHTLGRFRLALTSSSLPVFGGSRYAMPPNVDPILEIPVAERSEAQQKKITAYFHIVETDGRIKELEKQIDEIERTLPSTLITVATEPRVIRILPRGNWMDDSGPIVQPAVPAFMGGTRQVSEGERLTRLDLARWLVAPSNPLTARVTANRLWALCMGTGLSKDLDDLGAQGEMPSHPQLLDYLAVYLIESGWDLKATLRLIVNSATYRQSSLPRSEMAEVDPYNRLLGSQSRWRLDAEMVRDNALAVSGLLVRTIGGPSAKPYQPPGYYDQLNFPKREYQADKGDGLYRRGLYTHWQRTFLHPMLLAFDAPTREECAAERARSNTPVQSLVLLNDPSFVEAARVFATRIVREGGNSVESRIRWACRHALHREPQAAETALLAGLYQRHQQWYSREVTDARELMRVGNKPVDEKLDESEVAAWTSVARTLFNLHEFITRN